MLDLFGEVIVTQDEVVSWVAALAPSYMATERSFARYVRLWDVAGKVRAAKLAGTFDATIENARARRAFLSRRYGLY
ncbi:hypothetical protein [Burkholderia ubonensis]|uniref:hypothetical protein n=1 Tax=Burkholderia ubonensis TaxID=101571 RepID=UPI000F58C225|nr:hypothetical protein [Burkholderia ubonensis]RQP43157.1 hypothetical protein DF155_01255 [Burkholderia ubonensis]RQP44057.1 hypothetical protein DF154_07620 [Burkholderia ubonensis]RQP46957.1 hypothetical protein DF156_01625 [Burkholderia ubonensis]RQP60385.1 hypothetical protein DF144_04285 [Burkholderia ubonensis]RQP66430.1 hypothetical protein DF151_02860 [Burkholderia ubonensis]